MFKYYKDKTILLYDIILVVCIIGIISSFWKGGVYPNDFEIMILMYTTPLIYGVRMIIRMSYDSEVEEWILI